MASYAKGKKAFGFCDRCGFRYDLKDLKSETVNLVSTNLLVCEECWDPDHPQNMLGRIRYDDPQALRNPRPLGGISGRDLPAAYRWDFKNPTVTIIPSGAYAGLSVIDGWFGAQCSISAQASSESLRIDGNNRPNPDLAGGDPQILQGFDYSGENDHQNLNIDTSVYKYVVSSFRIDTPTVFTDNSQFVFNFDGSLFWTDQTTPSPYPWSADRRQIAKPFPYLPLSQAASGFSASDKNMTTRFKLVWDMSNDPTWTGTVTGLRIDYMDSKQKPRVDADKDSGIIDVDYIEVVAFHNIDL